MGIVRDYALYAYLTALLININKCPRAMQRYTFVRVPSFFLSLSLFFFFFVKDGL